MQNEEIQLSPSTLKPHTLSKTLYEQRDNQDLISSIKEHGIFEPIIITPDNIVVSGSRRLQVALELKLENVPCIVKTFNNENIAVIEYNRYRVKTPLEIYKETQILKQELTKITKERQLKTLKQNKGKPDMPNLAERWELPEGQSVREEVAKRIGVSHGWLDMLDKVIESDKKDIIEKVNNNTLSVSQAYRIITKPEVETPNIFIGSYFAGKQQLASHIISLIPQHKTYCELFGGYASVLLNKPPSEVEIYNDITRDVVNVLLALREYAIPFMAEIKSMPWSREYYKMLIEELFTGTCKPVDINRAAKWWLANEMTFSGISSSKPSQGNWRHGVTRDVVTTSSTKFNDLLYCAARLRSVQIENQPYDWVLETYDTDDTLFYADPPYFNTDDAVGISWTQEQHKGLAKKLSRVRGKWILSYNNHEAVRSLYKKYNIIEHTLPKRAPLNNTSRQLDFYTQLIITNF